MRILHLAPFALATVFLAACSSSSSSGPNPSTDAGGDTNTTTDSSSPSDSTPSDSTPSDSTPADGATDSGTTEGGTDSGPQDAGPPPPGKKIGSGVDGVVGVTDDNYAVWFGWTGGASIAPLDGSAAELQIDTTAGATPSISGKVVFSWNVDYSGSTSIAALRVWSKALGTAKDLATNGLPGMAVASVDGTSALYIDNAASDGSKGDLMFVPLAGGTPKTIAAGISTDSNSCAPSLSAAGGIFVAATCASGATTATIIAIDATTGATTPITTSAMPFASVDKAGDKVFVVSSTGAASIITIGGATNAVDTGVSAGKLSLDGTFAIYQTSAGALKRSGVSTPIVASGVQAILTTRDDLSQAIYATDLTGNDLDLHLVATTAGAKTIDLDTATDGELYGTPFTTDGAFAVYFTGITSDQTGKISATATTGGSARDLATAGWTTAAIGGSKIAFNDNWVTSASNDGTADLYTVDLSQSAAPKLQVAAADADFAGAPATGQVVYSWSNDDTNAGVYVLTP